jgi:hypothetical protein
MRADAICVRPDLSVALEHRGRDKAAALMKNQAAPANSAAAPGNLYSDRRIHMSLINLIIVLLVVGVLLWLVNTYIPMDGKIKNILNIVVVIVVVLWLLQAFGVLGSLDNIRIGR